MRELFDGFTGIFTVLRRRETKKTLLTLWTPRTSHGILNRVRFITYTRYITTECVAGLGTGPFHCINPERVASLVHTRAYKGDTCPGHIFWLNKSS